MAATGGEKQAADLVEEYGKRIENMRVAIRSAHGHAIAMREHLGGLKREAGTVAMKLALEVLEKKADEQVTALGPVYSG